MYKSINITPSKTIFTGRNEVVAKVIFLHLSVILFRGGVCLSACWDTNPLGADPPGADPPGADPPGADTPQSRHPPEQIPPPDQTPLPEQTPPRADTPRSRHPPGADTPRADTHLPPSPPGSRLQHTVYERPVRILLECILVVIFEG